MNLAANMKNDQRIEQKQEGDQEDMSVEVLVSLADKGLKVGGK